jgi:hypothetical protein
LTISGIYPFRPVFTPCAQPQYLKYMLGAIVDAWFGSNDLPGQGPPVVAINGRGPSRIEPQHGVPHHSPNDRNPGVTSAKPTVLTEP